MARETFGRYLVNQILPEAHRIDKVMTKGSTHKLLVNLAQTDRAAYADVATRLKKLGDHVATLDGISVGLDDIAPSYKDRDAILSKAVTAFKTATTPKEREDIIVDTQSKLLSHTKSHPGTMTVMATSGSRGNIGQMMKAVSSPVAAVDGKGVITPWLITKSYAEGLPAADYWIANNESRLNTIQAALAVSEPGDAFKVLTNSLYSHVITEEDCKTRNGITMLVTDGHCTNRYLATQAGTFAAGTLVTKKVAASLAAANVTKVNVRSPSTCEAEAGLCVRCAGLDENLRPHHVGSNLGVRAAQAMAEPLTQFSLSAKHSVKLLTSGEAKPQHSGVGGLRQLLDVPLSFLHKATLAEITGTVTKITPAPHGGHNVYVSSREHYVPPAMKVVVVEGQRVEAGDILSDGVPKPDEVVQYKGIGVGRQYLTDVTHDLYKRQGVDLDKRHLELLSRALVSHVKVTEAHPDHPGVLRGDLLPYEKYRTLVRENSKEVSLAEAHGHPLAEDVMQYSTGTVVTENVAKEIEAHGYKRVKIAVNVPQVEAYMRSMLRTPLLNPDWLARMSHKFLKDSVLKAAHNGETADLHSTHPVPAYALGLEFGKGKNGRY